MVDEGRNGDIEMDAGGLYREEVFTDRRVGTLQRLTPVTAAGDRDPARAVLYVGQAQVLTPAGALPLSFEVEARSLEEAVARFGNHAREALVSTMQKLEELRREAASSIIVPGGGLPPGGRSGNMPGGLQMP